MFYPESNLVVVKKISLLSFKYTEEITFIQAAESFKEVLKNYAHAQ